jgi:hypothetical protein
MALFQNAWAGIIDVVVRVDGVYSDKKFAGCAQAHINAIRAGFGHTEPGCSEHDISVSDAEKKVVLVLEDDTVPSSRCTKEKLRKVLQEANNLYKKFHFAHLYQVCDNNLIQSLGEKELTESLVSFKSQNFLKIKPNGLVLNANMMIYSITCLQWLDEYEKHVTNDKHTIPNDRLNTIDKWVDLTYNPVVGLITKQNYCSVGSNLGSDNGSNTDILHTDLQNSPEHFSKLLRNKKINSLVLKNISNDFRLNVRVAAVENAAA